MAMTPPPTCGMPASPFGHPGAISDTTRASATKRQGLKSSGSKPGNHAFDPEKKHARPADKQVRNGGCKKRVCSREDPAPEHAGKKGRHRKGKADMRMCGGENEV